MRKGRTPNYSNVDEVEKSISVIEEVVIESVKQATEQKTACDKCQYTRGASPCKSCIEYKNK